MWSTRRDKYLILYRLVEYLCGLPVGLGEFDPPLAHYQTTRVAHLHAMPVQLSEVLLEAKHEVGKLGVL